MRACGHGERLRGRSQEFSAKFDKASLSPEYYFLNNSKRHWQEKMEFALSGEALGLFVWQNTPSK